MAELAASAVVVAPVGSAGMAAAGMMALHEAAVGARAAMARREAMVAVGRVVWLLGSTSQETAILFAKTYSTARLEAAEQVGSAVPAVMVRAIVARTAPRMTETCRPPAVRNNGAYWVVRTILKPRPFTRIGSASARHAHLTSAANSDQAPPRMTMRAAREGPVGSTTAPVPNA